MTKYGQVEVSKSMLIDKIERVSSKHPALVKLYGTTNPEAPHRPWLALFSEAPRTGFRVFDESGITKIFKKKQPIEFFKQCNRHNSTRNYSRALFCGNCGSTMHSKDVCMALSVGIAAFLTAHTVIDVWPDQLDSENQQRNN